MRINGSFIAVAIFYCSMVAPVRADISWPSGKYGLPRPKTGCPPSWTEGYRYHDTENEHSDNRHSVSYHLSGSVSEHGVRQEFCMKDDMNDDISNKEWPAGQYCVYKYGEKCPVGLEEGWVFWDDEDSDWMDGGNVARGDLPEGVYEIDTLIYFCCKTNGSREEPMTLPAAQPFYLFPYGAPECPKVKNMRSSLEYIQWDDEDRGNTDSHSENTPYGLNEDPYNTKLFFCFYTAGICSTGGAICRNVTIDEDKLQAKSALLDDKIQPYASQKKSDIMHLSAQARRASGIAVGIGCGVAGAIVGSAVIGLVMKHVLKKRADVINNGSVDDDEEEAFPMPDHIW